MLVDALEGNAGSADEAFARRVIHACCLSAGRVISREPSPQSLLYLLRELSGPLGVPDWEDCGICLGTAEGKDVTNVGAVEEAMIGSSSSFDSAAGKATPQRIGLTPDPETPPLRKEPLGVSGLSSMNSCMNISHSPDTASAIAAMHTPAVLEAESPRGASLPARLHSGGFGNSRHPLLDTSSPEAALIQSIRRSRQIEDDGSVKEEAAGNVK